ncbi:hypothetical protein scyTo_0023782, partial [Scyliorhinus torazame]|nr:hypothetical protein [Scyliorhinus torazame]
MVQRRLGIKDDDHQLSVPLFSVCWESIPVDNQPGEISTLTTEISALPLSTTASIPNIVISNEIVNDTKTPVK